MTTNIDANLDTPPKQQATEHLAAALILMRHFPDDACLRITIDPHDDELTIQWLAATVAHARAVAEEIGLHALPVKRVDDALHHRWADDVLDPTTVLLVVKFDTRLAAEVPL